MNWVILSGNCSEFGLSLYFLWLDKMAGQGEGEGKGSEKLTDNIACIKYTVFCFNIVAWVSHCLI